jgi:hypothetical protein
LNPTHHALFVETKFLNDIVLELKNYAASVGYNINTLGDQFFRDMAWGALDQTDVFKDEFTLTEQNRIKHRIGAELYNTNYNGTLPKASKACE